MPSRPRAVTRLPVLGRVLRLPPVERVVSTFLRGRLVRESGRFMVRELVGSRSTRRYHLRDSGLVIHVRHSSPDIFGLDQAFYQRLYDPPEAVARRIEEIDRPVRAVDLGANIGTFGLHVLALQPDARITSFEPDPGNARLLAETIRANDAQRNWTLIQACAAVEDGTVRFSSGQFGVSMVTADGDVIVPAVDAFPYLFDADLIKIDIEGSEWELLADERFRSLDAAVIHLEYHERMCPPGRPETVARQTLENAGFQVHLGREGAMWGWRP